MLLALDVGNTQTSFGVFKDRKLLHHWRAETHISRTADEYAAFLFPLLQNTGLKPNEWDGIAICSVVPPATETFSLLSRTYLKVEPFCVGSGHPLGFELNVESPQEVGADRLANSAYAVKHLKLPAVVVDFGTATTFDVITTDKVYQGGIILPGIRMGAMALSQKTSLLPLVDVHFPKDVIGKNTVTCIQSGILYGYCDMINGLLRRVQMEVGSPCTVVVTGGLAPLVLSRLEFQPKFLPDLTLEGTLILFEQARKA